MTGTGKSVVVLAGLGCLLLGLNGAGLWLQRDGNLPGFVAVALMQGIIYLIAVWEVCRSRPKRGFLAVILIFAALLRLSILFSPPFLSDDIYRYVWDGRVQAAGVNPYRFVPADPRLAPLRDSLIYPHINRRDYARTIYPPLAQMAFLLLTRISESVTWMKAAMVGLEAIAMWLLLRTLRSSGLPPERVLIYAWHPLAIWEISGSGHVEAAVVVLVALALWSSRRELPALTGAAVAGAALIKLFPAVLLAAFYRRWDWKMPLAFAGVVLLAYVPYARVGVGALGFLPGYLQEEGLLHGWGIFPLSLAIRLFRLPDSAGAVYMVVAAASLIAIGLWLILRRSAGADRIPHAILLALAFSLLLSPHYSWYFLFLIPMLCLRPYVPALFLTVASFILYELLLQTSGPVLFRINVLLYLPFALLAFLCRLTGRKTSPAPEATTEEIRSAAFLSK